MENFGLCCTGVRFTDYSIRVQNVDDGLLSVNTLVSDQARCLTKTSHAMWAAVRAFLCVDTLLVPPEVRYLLENLPAIIACFGLNGIDR